MRALLAAAAPLLLAACATAPRPAASDDIAALQQGGVDPAAIRCNKDNRFGGTLKEEAAAAAAEALPVDASAEARAIAERKIFWRLVRAVLLEGDNNNFGALALRGRTWTDRDGKVRPVLI